MANRKLLAEIDKTLKKVTEGVDIFEGILEKLHAATNMNQKEKFEADLKKEIKKLQRLRDQIKGWISSADIKDKNGLIESRKVIETQMERFKACEREMKTKAYSREGLSAAAKIDPKEKEKAEMGNWISTVVDRLNTQVDAFEAKLELLQASSKKSKKGNSDAERQKQLEARILKHKDHMAKLELALRLLENGVLQTEQIGAIKEDVEYYIDNNEDADFVDDEFIYDDLNLEEEGQLFTSDDHAALETTSDVVNPKKDEKRLSKDSESIDSSSMPSPASPSRKTSQTSNASGHSSSGGGIPVITAKANPAKATTNSSVKATSTVAVAATAAAVPASTSSVISGTGGSSKATSRAHSQSFSSAAASAVTGEKIVDATTKSIDSHNPNINANANANAFENNSNSMATQSPSFVWNKLPASVVSAPEPKKEEKKAISTQRKGSESKVAEQGQDFLTSSKNGSIMQKERPLPTRIEKIPVVDTAIHQLFKGLSETLASLKEKGRSEEERLGHLDASFQCIPDSIDGENMYVPSMPFSTSPHYPTMPLPIFENPVLYEKFELDTLFFIFYYQQRTYNQYLAARELKRQSWRFHKKYLTWFQRHEEPKSITEEYEQGTYIYFDYEGAWCQRKKSDFTFEYRYLEDAELL